MNAELADETQLRVVTLNLYRTRARWRRRRPLIVQELARLAPDVVMFQEVDMLRGQAADLAAALGRLSPARDYRAFVSRKRGWRGLLEGVAVVTWLPVMGAATLALGADRIAGRVRVSAGAGNIDLYSVHLSGGRHERLRLEQAEVLSRAIAENGALAVVAGDLNAGPGTAPLQALEPLRSAHLVANGAEPARSVGWSGPDEPGQVLDYILVSPGIGVIDCKVAFAGRDSHGTRASDHYGLAATLALDVPGAGVPP